MTVYELHKRLSEIYPRSLSCAWDNDGIMVSPELTAEVRRILISLDATDGAIKYALDNGFDTVVTHHPMIFRGLKSVSPDILGGRRVRDAILGGLSILSFHTRLDAADGGVNDTLCSVLGYTACGKFGDAESPEIGRVIELGGMRAADFAALVKEKLGCASVRLNGDGDAVVRRAAVCGGDGKELVIPAMLAGCDVFLTGDAGYNITADASHEGLVTVEAGHYHTEAPVCETLSRVITELCGAECEVYNSCTYRII